MHKLLVTESIMNVIINIIKLPDTPKPLGRWYYSKKTMIRR